MRHSEVGVVTAIVVVTAVIIGIFAGSVLNTSEAALFFVVLGLVADFFVQRRVRAWAYCERDDDLLIKRGVMIKRLSVVPCGRMQFVDVTAGPAERSFGLATVRMHTAAAASDARIPGLSQADADRLRDQLAALGESRAAGL